jgi:hypothetical protein
MKTHDGEFRILKTVSRETVGFKPSLIGVQRIVCTVAVIVGLVVMAGEIGAQTCGIMSFK